MRLCPVLGTALQALGAAVRYGTSLSARAREMAILAVTAHADCAFEWHAHEAVGRLTGLTAADLAAIRAVFPLAGANEVQRTVVDVTFDLLRVGGLDEQSFQNAVSHLHPAGLQELMALVGHYPLLALQMRAFRVDAP